MFISVKNTILFLMSTYVYELSLYETPPSWLQWSVATVVIPPGVSKSKVLLLCVLNLFYLNGSLWFLNVCYPLCVTRGYSYGLLQWRFLCIISLVVDIADYMVSEMKALALALLRTFHIQFFGDTSTDSTDSTGTQINTHTHTHTHASKFARALTQNLCFYSALFNNAVNYSEYNIDDGWMNAYREAIGWHWQEKPKVKGVKHRLSLLTQSHTHTHTHTHTRSMVVW